MPTKLWIDDQVEPPDESWHWVKNVTDAFNVILAVEVGEISFDHDLGGPHNCTPIARFYEVMADLGIQQFRIKWTIHSGNPTGARNLENTLTNADKIWASAWS